MGQIYQLSQRIEEGSADQQPIAQGSVFGERSCLEIDLSELWITTIIRSYPNN
jgi:hypothetical protein